MLRVGDRVPDFTLPMATGTLTFPPGAGRVEVPRFRLSEAIAHGDIVLSFFPLAFTPVCTRQACDVADIVGSSRSPRFYGFSANDPFTNAHFARTHALTYPIVCDPNRDVLPRIWEVQEVLDVGRCAKRGIMIVGETGAVKDVWVTDDPYAWPPTSRILRDFVPRSRAVSQVFRKDAPS